MNSNKIQLTLTYNNIQIKLNINKQTQHKKETVVISYSWGQIRYSLVRVSSSLGVWG